MHTIYYNGDIVTVDETLPAAEAVVVENGKIAFVGSVTEALEHKRLDTGLVDLEGKTILPGFIDPHSHYLMAASTANFASLSSPPIGTVESIEDIIAVMRAEIETKGIKPGQLVVGWGYDESLLKEGRVPTNRELDTISEEHPIFIIHQSAHKGVANSILLEQEGINEDSVDPEGGHIGRYPGTSVPNGTLEEQCSMRIMMRSLMNPDPGNIAANLTAGSELYAGNGITTAQDGGLTEQSIQFGRMANEQGLLKIDLVGYVFINSPDDFTLLDRTPIGSYDKHLKIGGAKLLLDGSPQAKTAWLSKPYHIPPPGMDATYSGYPFHKDEEYVVSVIEGCLKRGIQILTHTNGDQASEQLISAYEKARERSGIETDVRPVMIHAQTVREDQLDRMKPINMIPSFFQAHTFFWGDWHINSVLGKERAYRISPVKSALDREIVYTLHQDTPVVPPNMLFTLWTAVNRKTRSGEIIGPDQRVSVMEAIRGITINGAYQYFEEDSKGSITPGKRADMVMLDRNPLKVDKDEIKDIKVLETIKDGNTIFKRHM